MNFMELVQSRESVRKYKSDPVEREKIERCLEAARLAPSACNSQPWSFVVVDDPDLKEKVATQTHTQAVPINRFVHQAPVIVVLVLEKSNISAQLGGMVKNLEYRLIDIGIAAEHFCLQAADEGLGTCMLGWFNEKPIQKLLKIPNGKRIGLLLTLGYPETDKTRAKNRKSLEVMTHYNGW